MRDIVPINQLQRRPPEAGRIRMGEKHGKGMRSLDHFRFTSPQRDLLDQLAAIYGGTPRPWSDPKARVKEQFELYSQAKTIDVYLIPDGLSIWYEAWAGGGNQRRCDGEMCEVSKQVGPDEFEPIQVPCMCRVEGARICSPYTRLQVVIPHVSFAGVWRLETKGWNAAAELPGMYDMVVALGEAGQMVQATLGIDRREEMHHGRKRNFVVPRIAIKQTTLELQQGAAAANALGSGVATPALGRGESPLMVDAMTKTLPEHEYAMPEDDGIVDAEVLDDELVAIEENLRADARNFGLDPARYVDAIRQATNGDRTKMNNASTRVRAGEFEPVGFRPDGTVLWSVKQ